jgi:ribosomal protein S27AE
MVAVVTPEKGLLVSICFEAMSFFRLKQGICSAAVHFNVCCFPKTRVNPLRLLPRRIPLMFLHRRHTRVTNLSNSSQHRRTLKASRRHFNAVIADVSTQATQAASPGFCGLEGVNSPSALKAHWYQLAKPKLDALHSACLRCGPEVQLLYVMDALNCELKNMQIKSRHCATQHSDR